MSDLIDRWRKGRAEFYTEDSMYSIGDKMAAELAAAKAREETLLRLLRQGRDILSNESIIKCQGDLIGQVVFGDWAVKVNEVLAASEPGEEGT